MACVLAEPALTNIGIVLPEPGFHEALRDLTRGTGTLLSSTRRTPSAPARAGTPARTASEPDLLTIGKAIGSGIPSAAYGFTEEVADRHRSRDGDDESDVGGIGGTLAANVLSLAAMRATLEHVLTDEAFARA